MDKTWKDTANKGWAIKPIIFLNHFSAQKVV